MPTELYTQSRLKVLRRCLAEHHFRYALGIRTPETDAMRFGTLGHLGLEHYLRAWQEGCDPQQRLARALLIVERCPDPVDRVKLQLLVIGYHERWGAADWTILAVEQQFEYQLGAYRIGGKVDAIIRNNLDGRVYVLEHKFTAADTSAGSTYWERLTIDTQISIYVDGAALLGHDVAGVIYDVIIRPRHDRLLATPEADRKFTKGKGCKTCGGSAGGKQGVQPGRGRITVTAPDGGILRDEECPACNGSKYSELPSLYAAQRDKDEQLEVFEGRVATAIAEAPDTYFKRSTIVRLADELPKMRLDAQQAIWLAEVAGHAGVRMRNPDACSRYGRMCEFYGACSGTADIADERLFPRGPVHAELAPNP